MILEVVRLILQPHFPAALRGCPRPCALVLANLMFQRRREDHGGYAFHAVRLIEVCIQLMQAFVLVLVVDRFDSMNCDGVAPLLCVASGPGIA